MGHKMGDIAYQMCGRCWPPSFIRAGDLVGAAGFEPTTTSPPDGLTPHDAPPSPSIHAHGEPSTFTDAHPEWYATWVTK
jgi:hypothetical protein